MRGLEESCPYLLEKVSCCGGHIGRNVHRTFLDFVKQTLLVSAVEWGLCVKSFNKNIEMVAIQ